MPPPPRGPMQPPAGKFPPFSSIPFLTPPPKLDFPARGVFRARSRAIAAEQHLPIHIDVSESLNRKP